MGMGTELRYLHETVRLERERFEAASFCHASAACREKMLAALEDCSSVEDWQQRLDEGLSFEMMRAQEVDLIRARAEAKTGTLFAAVGDAEAALADALHSSSSPAEFDAVKKEYGAKVHARRSELIKTIAHCRKIAALILEYMGIPEDYRIRRQWVIGSFHERMERIGGFDAFRNALLRDNIAAVFPFAEHRIAELLEVGAAMIRLDTNDPELSEVLTDAEKEECAAWIAAFDLDLDLPSDEPEATPALYFAAATGDAADGYELTAMEPSEQGGDGE